jgi:hypothetical protein
MSPSPGVRPDLATRLRSSKRALESRLGKPDTHLSLMRAAHATLDPERIGELLVTQAIAWFKVAHVMVIAADHEGEVVPIAGSGRRRQWRRRAGCLAMAGNSRPRI